MQFITKSSTPKYVCTNRKRHTKVRGTVQTITNEVHPAVTLEPVSVLFLVIDFVDVNSYVRDSLLSKLRFRTRFF